uniref:Odorant receptor n=1 Tax=Photinus pyralis TaxID=7054 RepID=A0A1Y1LDH0_PHOPY
MQISVYWGMAFTTVSCTILFTLYRRIANSDPQRWVLAYGPLTILDTTKSPYYEITLFYQNFAMSCCTILFTATDLLIASVLAHISYQFKILQNYMTRLVKDTYIVDYKGNPNVEMSKATPLIPWKYLQRSHVKFLKYHLAVIDIAREMEEAFSTLLLLVYLGTIGLLCFEIYRGSVLTNYLQMVRTIGEIVSFLVQIGTLSFWGEQVIFQSQLVAKAAYETDFVGTDLRFQKALILTMIRSQRPVKLTAGKFAFIQLFTFTWVVKTSYSAFMILRSAQN